MERIWLSSYPDTIPADIDPSRFDSLVHLCERSFADYPECRAFGNFGCFLTYEEFDKQSRDLAAFLAGDENADETFPTDHAGAEEYATLAPVGHFGRRCGTPQRKPPECTAQK